MLAAFRRRPARHSRKDLAVTLFSSITGAPPLSATNRQIFFKLMPLLMLCYFMSFLGRSNICPVQEGHEIAQHQQGHELDKDPLVDSG